MTVQENDEIRIKAPLTTKKFRAIMRAGRNHRLTCRLIVPKGEVLYWDRAVQYLKTTAPSFQQVTFNIAEHKDIPTGTIGVLWK